jgi:hypothetical protein
MHAAEKHLREFIHHFRYLAAERCSCQRIALTLLEATHLVRGQGAGFGRELLEFSGQQLARPLQVDEKLLQVLYGGTFGFPLVAVP